MNGNEAIDRQLQIRNAADSTVGIGQLSAIRWRSALGGADVKWQRGDGERRPFLEMLGSVEGLHPPPMF